MLTLYFKIRQIVYPFKTYVINNLNYEIILGKDFLTEYNGVIDFKHKNLTLEPSISSNKTYQLSNDEEIDEYNEIVTTKRKILQTLSTTTLNVPCDFPTKNEYYFEPNKELFLKENLVLQLTLLSGDNRIVTAMVSNPTNELFE